MVFRINGEVIPVIWENNKSVKEIEKQVKQGDIRIGMSMYGGFEQVGHLGRRYVSSDKQMKTKPGDIVLYSSSQLVVFYGSNSWSYTRLGRMNISAAEAKKLLSNGDVTVIISED